MDLQESICSTSDSQRVAVPTPEWPAVDGRLFAIRKSTPEVMAFWDSLKGKKGLVMVYGVIAFTVDAEGRPVFGDSAAEWLETKSYAALRRLWSVIDELNYLTDAPREIIRKNSETTPD